MAAHGNILVRAFALALAALLPVFAQAETQDEFWPELNAYIKLEERVRLYLLATSTSAMDSPQLRGGQDPEVGAYLDFTLTPIFRPALMDADWERDRYVWVRAGYSRIGEGSSAENRGILELTTRYPQAASIWIVGRLRYEARDIGGQHSDRYRIRLGVEREVSWFWRIAVPYVTAEAYYDTRYDDWNRQQYRVGAEIALDDRWRIEPYLARQNDTRSQPEHVNALGLALKYYR